MKKLEFKGYELYESYDRDFTHIAYFTNQADAEKARNGNAYQTVREASKTLVVFQSYDEYVQYQADSKRRVALAKLTPEERAILGVKDE